MWRKIIIKSNRIESNAISFECSIECQAYDGTIKLSPNERSLFHRQFGMANVIHKMNKINSEFLSACMCVDGRRNYFLWGKKIVQNVIRFTFFFLPFIDFVWHGHNRWPGTWSTNRQRR